MVESKFSVRLQFIPNQVGQKRDQNNTRSNTGSKDQNTDIRSNIDENKINDKVTMTTYTYNYNEKNNAALASSLSQYEAKYLN